MSTSGGLSKLGPPNLHERSAPECVCDRPAPARDEDETRCVKCGRSIYGRLQRRLREVA